MGRPARPVGSEVWSRPGGLRGGHESRDRRMRRGGTAEAAHGGVEMQERRGRGGGRPCSPMTHPPPTAALPHCTRQRRCANKQPQPAPWEPSLALRWSEAGLVSGAQGHSQEHRLTSAGLLAACVHGEQCPHRGVLGSGMSTPLSTQADKLGWSGRAAVLLAVVSSEAQWAPRGLFSLLSHLPATYQCLCPLWGNPNPHGLRPGAQSSQLWALLELLKLVAAGPGSRGPGTLTGCPCLGQADHG